MTVGIVVSLAFTVALANTLVLLIYVVQLRSRKSGQRALLARDLGVSALALKDKKVVGFFHPFWWVQSFIKHATPFPLDR